MGWRPVRAAVERSGVAAVCASVIAIVAVVLFAMRVAEWVR